MFEKYTKLRPRIMQVEGKPMVSSLVIAEHFDKKHFHIMRDIKELVQQTEESGASNFVHALRINTLAGNRADPYYHLTEAGFSLLVPDPSGRANAIVSMPLAKGKKNSSHGKV